MQLSDGDDEDASVASGGHAKRADGGSEEAAVGEVEEEEEEEEDVDLDRKQSAVVELYVSSVTPTVQSRKHAQSLRTYLEIQNVRYREYDVSLDPARLRELQDRSEHRALPQLFVNGRRLGGWPELEAMEEQGTASRFFQ